MPKFIFNPDDTTHLVYIINTEQEGYQPSCGRCGTMGCSCEEQGGMPSGSGRSAIQKPVLELFGVPRPWISLGQLAREFYGAYYIALTEPDKRTAAEAIIGRVADDLTGAIAAAAGGEARHVNKLVAHGMFQTLNIPRSEKLHEYDWPMRTKYLGEFFRKGLLPNGGSRTNGAELFYETMVVPYGLRQAVRSLRNLFIFQTRMFGAQGVGGAKWASGLSLVLKRLEGEVTDARFCDAAFDLVHNGGTYLDKTNLVPGSLYTWLDNRALASGEWLIRWLPNEARMRLGYYPVKPLRMDYTLDYRTLPPEFVETKKQTVAGPPVTLESWASVYTRNAGAGPGRVPSSALQKVQATRSYARNRDDGHELYLHHKIEPYLPPHEDYRHRPLGSLTAKFCPICRHEGKTTGCGESCCAPKLGPKRWQDDKWLAWVHKRVSLTVKLYKELDKPPRWLHAHILMLREHMPTEYHWTVACGGEWRPRWKLLRDMVEEVCPQSLEE